MHFKRVANTINRPHFIAERDGDVLLLNFCSDHKTMRCRTLDLSSEETPDSSGGFGTSVFGYDDDRDDRRSARAPKPKKSTEVNLSGHSKHGLGSWAGKVYFLDDSPKTETTNIWRVDCETGRNEYTKIQSGFITRFSDSEYFVVSKYRESNRATIYQWKSGENAEIIKTIAIPTSLGDHTRIAYGSKLLWTKIEGNTISVNVIDVITAKAANKIFSLDDIGDSTARWFCAKNHLIAVISGRLIFIGINSLTYDSDPTNLEPRDKHHPFAVDSNGFIYLLSPTNEGWSVVRARDITLQTEVETRSVIPRDQNMKVPKTMSKYDDEYINVHFHVTHRGRILLDQTMKMLTTRTLGDVIRRSPEIPQPPATRLKVFYKEEEVLTFRTPQFLQMRDGDTIYAQFNDTEASLDTSEQTPGFFSLKELEALKIAAPKKNEVQKKESQSTPQKDDNIKVPKAMSKDDDKYINVHFIVTYEGRIFLDQTMNMLTTRAIGDVIRRSEMSQPQGTRLEIFYKNEEVPSFRTPQFLQMGDGDTIYAQFSDTEASLETEEPTSEKPTGAFSLQELEELRISAPNQNKGQKNAPQSKPQEPAMMPLDPFVPRPLAAPARAPSPLRAPVNDVVTPNHPIVSADPALRLIQATEAKTAINEKLLAEMQWLRSFVSGELTKTAVRLPDNYELELLQKKYARALMMMGRSEVQK